MMRSLILIFFIIGWYLSFYWGVAYSKASHQEELETVMDQSSKMSELIYRELYDERMATVEERIRKETADEFLDILQTTCENSGSIAINNSKGDERFYVCKSATFL